MKVRRIAMILALFCMLSIPAWPQTQDKATPVAATLQVFSPELETQWARAAQQQDPAALNRIVADDFHIWTSAPDPSGRMVCGNFRAKGTRFPLASTVGSQPQP